MISCYACTVVRMYALCLYVRMSVCTDICTCVCVPMSVGRQVQYVRTYLSMCVCMHSVHLQFSLPIKYVLSLQDKLIQLATMPSHITNFVTCNATMGHWLLW